MSMLQFKVLVSNCNKVVFLLLSSYYIFNHELYSIRFFRYSLLENLGLNSVLNYLEYLGVLIVLVPMIVVVFSLIVENKFLIIFSTINAIGGNIFSILYAISKEIYLNEIFRVGPFMTIYNNFSFEHKVVAFKAMFKTGLEQSLFFISPAPLSPSGASLELSSVLDSKFSVFVTNYISKHFEEILEPIKIIPMKDLQTYSNSQVDQLENLFRLSLIETQKLTNVLPVEVNVDISPGSWFAKGVASTVLLVVIVMLFTARLVAVPEYDFTWLNKFVDEATDSIVKLNTNMGNLSQNLDSLRSRADASEEALLKLINLSPKIAKFFRDNL